MKQFSKTISLFLAVIMVLSLAPVSALANPEQYTGLNVRLYNASAQNTVADAKAAIYTSTSTPADTFESKNLSYTMKWYRLFYFDFNIPEEERDDYTPYFYADGLTVYVKELNSAYTFEEDYLYLCELTVSSGDALFAEDMNIYPSDVTVQELTSTKCVIAYEHTAGATQETVQNVTFTCDRDGYITLEPAERNYYYVAKASDGQYDPLVFNMPVGAPVGSVCVNKKDYEYIGDGTELGYLDVNEKQQIQVLLVESGDYSSNESVTVVGYGIYNIPLSQPYLTVDSLKYGLPVTVTEVGDTRTGRYSTALASASFDGWFLDEDATQPTSAESESYAVFTMHCAGLFASDIQASDFTLKYNTATYTGAKIISVTELSMVRVAFFIPSDLIQVSCNSIGEGGTALVLSEDSSDSHYTPVISLKPYEWNNQYPNVYVKITMKPGYALKSIKINGEGISDDLFPYKPNGIYPISDIEDTVCSFKFRPTQNTVIDVEFTRADKVTIVFDGECRKHPNESIFHSSATYYVPEGYRSALCSEGGLFTFGPPETQLYLSMLNTEPDGSGYSPAYNEWSRNFYWEANTPFTNGEYDEITLYAFLTCRSHNLSDFENGIEPEFTYVDAKAPSCNKDGCVEHRICTVCGVYQVRDENVGGYWWRNVFPADVVLPAGEHNYTQYTDNLDGTHSAKCTGCDETVTEPHTFTDGVCDKCGALEAPAYLKGDVNGDGKINAVDYALTKRYVLKTWKLEGVNLMAADVNGDGKINAVDYVLIKRHVLKTYVIPQDR